NDGADAGYRYTGNENLAGAPGTGTLYKIDQTNYANSFIKSNNSYSSSGRIDHATVLNVGDSRDVYERTANWNTAGIDDLVSLPTPPSGLQTVKDGSNNAVEGSWSTDFIEGDNATYIDFDVDLAYTDLLANPNQQGEVDIAIHWTMTCANDIIQAKASVSAVPIPPAAILMISGLAGLGLLGRRRSG
ncbi:MAG: hypothetical protein ABW185_26325, partial [Sedimenticola sp.]